MRDALIRVLLCLLLVCVSGDAAEPPAAPVASPIPVRRIAVSPDRLPQELERVKQGVLVQLPQTDLEERLRQAGEAVQAQKNPPRLLESRYQAILADSALVGVGQWQVVHGAHQPGLLPLPSFNLSLRRPVGPGGDKGELASAVLGEFGKSQSLLLTRAGTQQVDLHWSLRGDARPDGLHFELQVPVSPQSALELYLPAGWQVSLPEKGGLIVGPQPLSRPPVHGKAQPSKEGLPEALGKLIQTEKALARAVPAGSRLVDRPPGWVVSSAPGAAALGSAGTGTGGGAEARVDPDPLSRWTGSDFRAEPGGSDSGHLRVDLRM